MARNDIPGGGQPIEVFSQAQYIHRRESLLGSWPMLSQREQMARSYERLQFVCGKPKQFFNVLLVQDSRVARRAESSYTCWGRCHFLLFYSGSSDVHAGLPLGSQLIFGPWPFSQSGGTPP